MARAVCAVAGGKGGVGRTTVALNIGATLEQYGVDATVVDADLSMPDTAALLDVESQPGLHAALSGEASLDLDQVEVDLPGDLTVIPGDWHLDAYGDADAANLKDVIEEVRRRAEVVLVDTGAGLSHETMVSLGIADAIVLVTTPETSAVRDARKTMQLADRVDGEVACAVVNRATERSDLEKVESALGVPVLGGIPTDEVAAGDEPLAVTAVNSDVATAYAETTDRFRQLLVERDPADSIEPAFDPAWVTSEPPAAESAEESRSESRDVGEEASGEVTDETGKPDDDIEGETTEDGTVDETTGEPPQEEASEDSTPEKTDEESAQEADDDELEEDEDDSADFMGGALPFG
jgi:septum site-determining protein MinD